MNRYEKSERIKEIVESVTYRPGFTLSAVMDQDLFMHGAFMVTLNVEVPDVNNPDKITIGHFRSRPIPFELTETPEMLSIVLPQAIWQVIERFENHERMKHLRAPDGRPIFDPHPNGKSVSYPDFGAANLPPLTSKRIQS